MTMYALVGPGNIIVRMQDESTLDVNTGTKDGYRWRPIVEKIGTVDEWKFPRNCAHIVHYIVPPAPPPAPRISTYTIVRRLEDAGKIDAANAALDANVSLKARFYTVGYIAADEPIARQFITMLGADPDVILAAE